MFTQHAKAVFTIEQNLAHGCCGHNGEIAVHKSRRLFFGLIIASCSGKLLKIIMMNVLLEWLTVLLESISILVTSK